MMRDRFSVWWATGLGVGWSPRAPGTMGSLVALALWWPAGSWGLRLYAVLLAAAIIIGVPVTARAARVLGRQDPPMVVWDEVAGMGVALFAVPHQVLWFAVAFGLFRLFDIVKPFPIARLEALPGGYGIMFDDVWAGLYAALLVHGGLWMASGTP
ncbi:phosphatidylglycerophosphatase A family protein [Acidiferrobacter thiooxydans]|nr:phosphatidylglycerophosphatase A [Acidiferrobacter thiooxydans]MDA8191077.1 phosphatidylglycerophosphatase A [Gammaproteobacteria bacterium]UEO00803.1 phosphatidylglycerophosphatase A [Acidiferrobacter thiooxydans]